MLLPVPAINSLQPVILKHWKDMHPFLKFNHAIYLLLWHWSLEEKFLKYLKLKLTNISSDVFIPSTKASKIKS